ncbi:MAG: hypothetical protein ABIA04_08775 [Pseudomonadota bacterium]
MKKSFIILVIMFLSLFMFSCSNFGDLFSGGDGTGEEREDTVPTLSFLSAIPSMDLSNLDLSNQSSSSNDSAFLKKQEAGTMHDEEDIDGAKEPDDMMFGAIGTFSRAGCEANVHKQEAIRISQKIQLDRCYFDGMEKLGLISIPADDYNYYKIFVPKMEMEEETVMEDADMDEVKTQEEESAADKEGTEDEDKDMEEDEEHGPKDGIVMARIGKFTKDDATEELRIDFCEGSTPKLVSEFTASLADNIYTASVIRKGEFDGKAESMSLSATIKAESVEDSIPDLGEDGYAKVKALFNGGHGKGSINFEAYAEDLSNIVYGAFLAKNEYEDIESGTYAKFGGFSNTGTAKFAFKGVLPAMQLSEMIFGPEELMEEEYKAMEEASAEDKDLEDIYAEWEAQLGVPVNDDTVFEIYLCFEKGEEGEIITVAESTSEEADPTCSVDENDIESFEIQNIEDSLGDKEQAFTIIAHGASEFYETVLEQELITREDYSDAFSRNWDCTAEEFVVIKPDKPEDMEVETTHTKADFEEAMMPCMELEEKLMKNEGFKEHSCDEMEMDDHMEYDGEEMQDMMGDEQDPCFGLSPDECDTFCMDNPGECEFGGEHDEMEHGDGPPKECEEQGLEKMDCMAYCQEHVCS